MKQGSVNPFEEVKKRVDLLGLIEKWTGATTRRSGKNHALPQCPFCRGHGCFSITPEKQLYHCFQCPGKAGGDVFDFFCKLRGCDKRAALEELAREAGYPLPLSRASGRDIREAILSQAKEDWNLSQARDAWEYLTQERRLSPDILKAHDVGYLGDRSRLIGILKKKGFTYEEIKNTGILTKGYGDFYEILFGWRASNGTLGGFIAGATKAGLKKVKPEEEEIYPKYKNAAGFQVDSPYNLYYAKRRVPDDATLVIVEGVLDCLQMLSHGLHNTVALGGTAFKEGYGKALEATRFERIILLLDSDRPGRQAVLHLIPFLMRNHPKFALYVTEITAPDPKDETRTIKDPDELIVKLGAEVIRKVIGHPVKAGPWLVLAMRDQHDMKNPLDRDRIFQEVACLWGYVPDEVERKEILRYLADGSELPQEDIRKTIERLAQRALTIGTGGERDLSEGNPSRAKEKAPSTEIESAELQRRADTLKEKSRDIAKKNKVLVQAYAAFVLQARELSRSGLLWHVNRLAEGHVKLLKQLRRDPVKAQSMIGRINEIFEASRLSHLKHIKGEIEALCKENEPDAGERAHAEAKGTESH